MDTESLREVTSVDVSHSSTSSKHKPHDYSVRKASSVISSGTAQAMKKGGDSRQSRDKQVVSMKTALTEESSRVGRAPESVEQAEVKVRESVASNPFYLALTGNYASLKVFVFYLITLDTIFSGVLTIGMTLFWYFLKVSEHATKGKRNAIHYT